MKIKLNNVRLSFPSLFQKSVYNGEVDKYEATFLMDKESDSKMIEGVRKAIAKLIEDKLGGVKISADKICLKDGDDIPYDGYEGTFAIKASNARRPMVIGRDKSPLTEDDGIIYAGCYVNAIIELWAQNNSWGKRVNANLLGVQFAKDGEPFGDGVSVGADDFDIIDDDLDTMSF